MAETLLIASVMSPSPFTIGPKQNLRFAREQMAVHGVRHLPVQDGGRLIGVLSERDINLAVAMDKVEPEQILVRDAISAEPFIVTPDTPVHVVARRMAHERIGCALVATDDRVAGIFTTVDAANLLAEVLSGSVEQ